MLHFRGVQCCRHFGVTSDFVVGCSARTGSSRTNNANAAREIDVGPLPFAQLTLVGWASKD